MTNLLEERLAELQKEYEAGQKMLSELESKKQTITTTMLRIEGAMQVLRELMAQNKPEGGGPPQAPAS